MKARWGMHLQAASGCHSHYTNKQKAKQNKTLKKKKNDVSFYHGIETGDSRHGH